MPTEPSETTEHIGSTGVRVVYRAPLIAGVSVLMNHKTQNDQLSECLTETSQYKKPLMKSCCLIWKLLHGLYGLHWPLFTFSGSVESPTFFLEMARYF